MYGHYGHYGYDGRIGDWAKKTVNAATRGVSGTLDALKKKKKKKKKPQGTAIKTKNLIGSEQIRSQAQAFINNAGNLPKALKDFILSGTKLSEVSLREMYAGLSVAKMREDLRSAKAFKVGQIKARNENYRLRMPIQFWWMKKHHG